MRQVILNKHAQFQGDRTTAGTITVINVKKHHISMANYLYLPTMLF